VSGEKYCQDENSNYSSTPATIFTKVYVDVMDMTESVQGHKFIVCARDDLSRATKCRALIKNDSAIPHEVFLGTDFIVVMEQ